MLKKYNLALMTPEIEAKATAAAIKANLDLILPIRLPRSDVPIVAVQQIHKY